MKITVTMSDMAIAREVYQRLEVYRQTRGISQETLVETLGISRPTYARIQKGTCSFGTFIGVLRVLDLLEGLNSLIPSPTLRPSEIIGNHKSSRSRRVKSSTTRPAGNTSVRAMLESRKKYKVGP